MLGNINSPINSLTTPCFQKIRLENIFSTFHHQKVPRRNSICSVTASFACFLLQISSAFAIIFADCHGLSCVHVRASSYTALFRVCLRGVGLRCVGLAQKISARCNTGSYVFSFFFIWIFILLLALSHIYVFLFPQRVPSDLEVGHEKSILTRTEILFYHYLFQRTPVIYNFISQENVFLFAIYFH